MTMPGVDPSQPAPTDPAWRPLSGVSFLAGAALALLLIENALDAGEIQPGPVALDVAVNLHERLAELPDADEPSAARFDAVFLGDSTVGGPGKAKSIPESVETLTNQVLMGSPTVRVHNLSAPGLGPFDYYFLAPTIAERDPDLAIILINLGTFSDSWTQTFRRPELAGLIPLRSLSEALGLPLYRVGVTTDSMLLHGLVTKIGALDAWHSMRQQQTRFNRARGEVRDGIDNALAGGVQKQFILARMSHFDAVYNLPDRKRLSVAGMQSRYGSALEGIAGDDPSLEMLAATLRIFHEAGVPTLLYINPINIEHAQSLGLHQEAKLQRTTDSIATVARDHDARLVDLHDRFSDDHFRDAAGHFRVRDPDAMSKIAQALTPAVAREAKRSLRAGKAQD
jgi:hypothetical protein